VTAYIGTAGWAIPRTHGDRFPAGASQLERYARVFSVAEINSSFRHEHRTTTYARWAAITPAGFRFSLKLPKAITHERRLENAGEPLRAFLKTARVLGPKLGPILVQLPPSLEYQRDVADAFFAGLRNAHEGPVVCEPRHGSWFGDQTDAVLHRWRVGRVAADPAVVPAAGAPGGWPEPKYYRLHGAPRKYFSSYDEAALAPLGALLRACDGEAWCIFDNTAHGAAAGDALSLLGLTGSA
jgi:uncharacterized protein YecE (DUF72 family)